MYAGRQTLTSLSTSSYGDRHHREVQQGKEGQSYQETGQEIKHCLSHIRRPEDNQEEEVKRQFCRVWKYANFYMMFKRHWIAFVHHKYKADILRVAP